jgi:hypothetical protein
LTNVIAPRTQITPHSSYGSGAASGATSRNRQDPGATDRRTKSRSTRCEIGENRSEPGEEIMSLKTLSLMAAVVVAACFVAVAQAAPFVVSDPVDVMVTHCGFKLDAAARTDVAVALSGTDKICKLDLAGLAAGSHTLTATAVDIDPVWGRRESVPSANFMVVVPTNPIAPSGLKLQP